MNPNEQPQQPTPQSTPQPQQQAAAQIVRGQIDSLYAAPTEQETTGPYQRTHSEHVQPTPEQWKQYHSAWQDYYQKYYERYYAGHLHQARQAINSQLAPQETPSGDETLDKDEAMYELRGKLVGSVKDKASKVRESRHFVPITSAVLVMLLFAFLQYNQFIMANLYAYVSPGAIDPQNIIIDPSLSTKVDPKLRSVIIPKINVDVPVDFSAKPDYDSQMAAMKHGLAYFGVPGADSKPGQVGNYAIAGHAGSDVTDISDYKFIFSRLTSLTKNDIIYVNYKGTRYTYVVTKTDVVLPTDVNKLVYKTDKPMLTLITCTPLGLSTHRLLVTAEQVSPSPTTAQSAPKDSGVDSGQKFEIAGTQPTVFERLFGGK